MDRTGITVTKLSRSALALLHLSAVVLFWLAVGQCCLAQQSDIVESETNLAGSAKKGLSAPPLVPREAIKSRPKRFEVYQYDSSPLAGRAPLLLIHGLEGEFHPLFRWAQLASYLTESKGFQQRYKLYLARYNSQVTLKEMTEAFSLGLRNLPADEPVTIVAISMPCLVVRNAMKNPEVDQAISRVLCLGGFFRGSPLFCSNWMHQTIAKRHLSPLCRLDRNLAYKIYFARHKNLLRDYRWDNSDGQMLAEDRQSGTSEDHGTASDSTLQKQSISSAQYRSDNKFIVYAAFLHNQFVPRPRGAVPAFLISPFTFLRTTLPAHFTLERPALRFLNYLIASAIPADGDKSRIIYPLNDGISPVTSSLLLPNDFVASFPLTSYEDISRIKGHSNARRARLFENADHLTFIEEHRPIGLPDEMADMLSGDEKPRKLFDWILKDLLE